MLVNQPTICIYSNYLVHSFLVHSFTHSLFESSLIHSLIIHSPPLRLPKYHLITTAAAADLTEQPPSSSSTTASTSTNTSNVQGEGSTTALATVTSNQVTPQQTAAKNAIETACAWSQFLSQMYSSRALASLPTGHPANPEGKV